MLIVCMFASAALQCLCANMDSIDLVLCKRDEHALQPAEMHTIMMIYKPVTVCLHSSTSLKQ